MTIIQEHRTEIRAGDIQYQVAVITRTDGGEPDRVTITVGGERTDGEPVAEGRLDLDVASVPTVAELLGTSLRTFAGGGARRRPRSRPARQGQPWSDEMDAELEARWLDGASIGDLARHFARTPGGIRARLPRVGCDPERPGNHLPTPPSLREAEEGVD
ncbi:helix-turn-helix domain containing protein [Amycolatopsis ultiminotia]